MPRRFLPLLLICLAFAFACDRSEDELPPDPVENRNFQNWTLIVNEGPFQNGSGTLTAYHPNNGEVIADVYTEVNPDAAPLGNIVQSIYRDEETVWIVVNNANRIVVADARTLEERARWEGFDSPRYFTKPPTGNLGAVTQWGADLKTGSLAFVDLTTGEIVNTIPLGPGPERPRYVGGELYIPLSGALGRDSTVARVDFAQQAVTFSYDLGQNPQSVEPLGNGVFVSLGQGFTADFSNPNDPANRPGALSIFSRNGNVLRTWDVPLGSKSLTAERADDLWFLTGGFLGQINVLRLDEDNVAAATGPEMLTARRFYQLAFHRTTDQLFASDPKDFQQNGQVVILDLGGTAVDSFPAGIGPGFISPTEVF